jgi:hypothetical protein
MAEAHLASAIDAIEQGAIDRLVAKFRSNNTMGTLLYMFSAMALSPREYENFERLLVHLEQKVSLNWVERCGMVVVRPESANLSQKMADDVGRLWCLIRKLNFIDKVKVHAEMKAAWHRYAGIN